MKKILILLPIVILTACLVGLALHRLAPASPASAASEVQPAASSASQVEKVPMPPVHPVQPVVYVVSGLVCVLFGILALSPLFLGDLNR